MLNRRIEYKNLSIEETRQLLVGTSKSEWHTQWRVDCLLEVCTKIQEGKKSFVNDELKKMLGRAPRTFSDFVLDYKHYFD